MRKLFFSALLCLTALSMSAQKCAVLEFRGSASVSVADIDGISEMFMTYFRPAGYTMVERAQIDKVISEQHFQRSNITDNQAVQLGKILNASMVILGKVSMLGGQYQVDVRAVNVQSGHDIAFEGATFSGDYRTDVRNIATKLAEKIARKVNYDVTSTNESSEYVDLGLPSRTKWKKENERGGFFTYYKAMQYYSTQIPTLAQMEELIDLCDWQWMGKGYKVTGPNGRSIYLPACGIRENQEIIMVNEGTIYMTSTISNAYVDERFVGLPIHAHNYREMEAYEVSANAAFPVRLVKK